MLWGKVTSWCCQFISLGSLWLSHYYAGVEPSLSDGMPCGHPKYSVGVWDIVSFQLEQFSQKLLEKESDTSIFLHWPTLDTPKHSCFCASLSGKRWELSALRITFYLYYITAINWGFGEKRVGVAIEIEVIPFSVLQKCCWGRSWGFFCNFYKYTAKRKRHFGNILTFWLFCFQFKPWVESWTGDHIKT